MVGDWLQHDAQFDYYGKRLATCSSDRSVRIYNVEGNEHLLSAELKGYVVAGCTSERWSQTVRVKTRLLEVSCAR